MKIVLWIFLVLLFLYLVFVLAPSVFSFLYSYSRREGKDLDTLPVKWLQKTQYRDHLAAAEQVALPELSLFEFCIQLFL